MTVYDRFYDDIEIGATATYGSVTVSDELVRGFADLTGDHHRLHVDDEFAAQSRFGRRIAHGFLVLSLAAGLFPMDPHAVIAFYGMDRVRFLAPTFVGDVLTCRLTVVATSDRPDGGVVDTDLAMTKADGTVVAVARMRLLVAARRAQPVGAGATV